MKRRIKKVAVLGSGVMGSRLACLFANIGLDVLLLDILPPNLANNPSTPRNAVANKALADTLAAKPSPIYQPSLARHIQTGNLDDDLARISTCDWVLEAVIENLDIKKALFAKVEQYRKPGTLITTNTSGIPIQLLAAERSSDFTKHFAGTHFFNPPRYLPLLEIIPGPETDAQVVDFLLDYGDRYLGKTTVLAKDTPAFIANRVGVYSILLIFKLMQDYGLCIEEIDAITGPLVGRPKSATFRTCDVVGIDTLTKVADNLYKDCPGDESRDYYLVPDYVRKMVANGWIGDKSGQGFYKKVKLEGGNSDIHSLDIKSLTYRPKEKIRLAVVAALKEEDNLAKRIMKLAQFDDKYGKFTADFFGKLFAYAAHRIPGISELPHQVDDAIKAGFGWEMGVFEIWDILGVAKQVEKNPAAYPQWVHHMVQSGIHSFYSINQGQKLSYSPTANTHQAIAGTHDFIVLDGLRQSKLVWSNKGASVIDLGDGVLGLEFHSKMNTFGEEVITALFRAIDLAEKSYDALVIGNDGQHFSAGANLASIFMLAIEQEYDELSMAVSTFQKAMMRVRLSAIPIVAAPFNLSLGGGCELVLHADAVQASAESYIGLVEVGAGLIPAGGGTKEFALRASDAYYNGDPELPYLNQQFMTIGMAKVSTSGKEAFDMKILMPGRDHISINRRRLLGDAKNKALSLARAGYTPPSLRTDIKVLGKTALGGLLAGAYAMQQGNYISAHDLLISQKLAYVICGGDLSEPQMVSEQYLLDLEREAFLSLLGEKKTLERIQSILKTGKPLRN
jgi:3-hydroxyacyl-CoA dehydrogenase